MWTLLRLAEPRSADELPAFPFVGQISQNGVNYPRSAMNSSGLETCDSYRISPREASGAGRRRRLAKAETALDELTAGLAASCESLVAVFRYPHL